MRWNIKYFLKSIRRLKYVIKMLKTNIYFMYKIPRQCIECQLKCIFFWMRGVVIFNSRPKIIVTSMANTNIFFTLCRIITHCPWHSIHCLGIVYNSKLQTLHTFSKAVSSQHELK